MEELEKLPSPQQGGEYPLERALQLRRSVRAFRNQALSADQISQLLWSAAGITDGRGHRTAPSAGAMYPLELYLVTPEAVSHYDPQGHSLRRVLDGDRRKDLFNASLQQEFILEAPATIVFTAIFARTEGRYGAARSPRYIYLEVGHAAQNVLLQAVALGLGAVPVGAYRDEQVQQVLRLPADHVPLYLVPVGYPAD